MSATQALISEGAVEVDVGAAAATVVGAVEGAEEVGTGVNDAAVEVGVYVDAAVATGAVAVWTREQDAAKITAGASIA